MYLHLNSVECIKNLVFFQSMFNRIIGEREREKERKVRNRTRLVTQYTDSYSGIEAVEPVSRKRTFFCSKQFRIIISSSSFNPYFFSLDQVEKTSLHDFFSFKRSIHLSKYLHPFLKVPRQGIRKVSILFLSSQHIYSIRNK